ncbi:polymorphic toxin-type HINT domain-containing protein [Streptomyces sp. NY05-11A]|uniref:polymorphic toxin-type HINT domain-containing protein n=1 Tax=Streptomyces soliscabiei TaxID=588897 RepID=UPI0029AE6893|nr:polymorphic toxin-type HINT domain-containing protein [Streptomyces sp. NY05-11A]MDX2676807.1 polymorphic toxin-type HINT domain-containing protein [Streptomyces sp. NY05-11A]
MPRPMLAATVLGLTLALSASSVQAVALDDGDRGRTSRPGVQDDGDPARGSDAKARSRPSDPARKAAVEGLDKAVWPEQGRAEVRIGGTAEAGGLPVSLGKPQAKATDAVDKVSVNVLDPKRTAQLGAGVLLGVARADDVGKAAKVRLTVDYSEFAEGFGGSYASRLQLVQLPACALVAIPGSKACPQQPTVLPTVNDVEAGTVSADVTAAPAPVDGVSTMAADATSLVAVAAGPSSAQGTYKATALAPSSSWNVAPSSGGFSWNYPLTSVPTPGGLVPTVGLGYSSQSADGRTSATNNQGSWLGEGFSYDPGYIERRYKPCSDDGHDGSGEQCWAFENATIMLNGMSGELVKDDTTDKWHLSSDDGTKVERLTGATNGDDGSAGDKGDKGEHWKITTPEGTEYSFGLNRLPGWATGNEETNSVWTAPVFGDDSGEPCYNAAFTSAYCQQAWRWSLDYVKDTHGNVMSYFYDRETNYYALNGKTDVNGTAYHRGGYLKRIDYGQRDGSVYAAKAPARVVFNTAERCLPTTDFDCAESKRTKANASYWPDVPVDQECKSGTKCTSPVQTFWTTKRLTSIVTQMRKDATTYSDVDAWSFTHLFTDNGDDSKTLWLSKIDHEGRAGTAVKLPSVELFGEQLANRVDAVGDNIAPFHRFRLSMVLSETGAQLDVTYAPVDCAKASLPKPGESTKRCYPVKWAPPGYVEPITDWFHKYVVSAVIETDRTGGGDSMVTRYDYQGDAAWRKAKPDGITDDKYLTWGGWQGYGKVKVTSGSSDKQKTRVDYTYLQGMDGDKDADGNTRSVTVKDSTGASYTDAEEFTGHQLEAATYDGGKLVSKTIDTPWKHYTATQTKSWGTTHAAIVRSQTGRGFSLKSDGTWRETRSATTYDTSNGTGRVLEVDDLGDVSTAKDDTCTRTTYADNAAKNILSLPARSESVTVKCATTPDRRTQVLADERTSYDKGAFGAAPTKGDATKTERMTSHDGTTATYQVTGATTYDDFGRPLSQQDAKQYGTTSETKTVYTETNGLLSKTVVTNALGHTTMTDFAQAWGMSAGQTDPNGKRTDLAYDALGRLTSVWLADRASKQTPSIKYSYNVRKDKVTSIKTEKIENDGTYGAEYQLYDSMLRPRQIQTEGPDGTRMVADTFYDATGNVRKTNSTYNAAGAAEGELFLVSDSQVGSQNLIEYDGLGRTTADIFAVSGAEQWRTTTVYDGESTHVNPPTGGVPTTTITDGQGNVSEIRHYQGSSPGAGVPYDSTKYTYNTAGLLETVTDAKDNVWRYEYDQLGRKKLSVDPDAGTSRTEYDELDRPIATYDGRNKKTSTVYDELGRVLSTWQGDAGTGTKLSETRYDKAGWLGQAYGFLSYISPTEYFATVVQSMDSLYRPLKTAYQIPASQGSLAGTYAFTTTYHTDGTVQTAGMPAIGDLPAESLVYTYDDLQRPTSMTGNVNSYVTNTVYSRTSQLQQLELSTGTGKKTWQTFNYETGTDRLTRSVVDVYGATAPAKDSYYSYDQSGNVLSIADTADTSTPDVQCFAYDGRQRLADAWTPAATATTAAGSGTRGSTTPVNGTGPTACDTAAGSSALGGPAPYWKSYETDAIGNRISETNHDTGLDATKNITRTYEYGGAGALGDGPHQVTKVTEKTPTGDRQTSYEYDDAGNTTKRTIGGNAQSLTWNDTGKVGEVTEANGSKTSYLYDASGNRLVRKDPSGTTVYLPGTELKLSADGTKKEATRYYEYAGQTVAVRTAAKLSFVATDHHGTGELAIDAATGAISQRRFDPFGVERGEKLGPWPGEKGYVGGTIDASTGLTHLGAREYDATIGKFISVDPIIDYTRPQQINGYAYADNSPVTLSDPSGLESCYPYAYCSAYSGTYKKETGNKDVDDAQSDADAASADVASAQAQQSSAKQRVQSAGKALIKIARDILGVDAALDCISSGDVGSCGETLLNIAGSFAGGLAGKIMAKYGAPWKWAKGLKLVKRVTGLVKDLIGGAKGLFKANKALGKARMGLAKATEKLAEARKKAAAALKKKGNDSCPAPGLKHSFLPGTKVLLANGKSKPIEQVKLGDRITATEPKTGKTAAHEVVGTIVTEDDKHFVDLTIKGKSGQPETLVSTTTHPFWADSEKAWIDAGDLKPGMRLHTAEDGSVELTGIRAFDKRQRTHDLTVSEVHTYYVLAEDTPVLVHNCGESPDERPGLDFTDSGRQKVYDENLDKNDGVLRCDYCGGSVERRASRGADGKAIKGQPDDAQIDHEIPKVHGGCGAPHNGCVACRRCNRDKSAKTPEEWDDELREFLEP